MFVAVKLLRNESKSKSFYNGWVISFDGEDSLIFSNGFARNVIIFGIDNGSISHTYNLKSNNLVLGEGRTDGINDSTGAAEKKLNVNLSKPMTRFCLSLHYISNKKCSNKF